MGVGRIERAEWLGYQPVGAEAPLLIGADPDTLSRAAGTRIGSHQRPVIFGLGAAHDEAIHLDHKIGKGGHEALRGIGDCSPPDCRRPVVDLERSLLSKKGGNARSVLAAPSS